MSEDEVNNTEQERPAASHCDFCNTPAEGEGHAALMLTAPTGAGICNGCIVQAVSMMNDGLMRSAATIEQVMRHHEAEKVRQEAEQSEGETRQ